MNLENRMEPTTVHLQERTNLEGAAGEIANRVAELDRRERALDSAEATWSDRLQQVEAKQQVGGVPGAPLTSHEW